MALASLKANLQLHARQDKTVWSVLRRFGGVNWITDNSRLSLTENLKSKSSCLIHTDTPDTTQTGPSCLVWLRCELSHPPTSAFSVGVCWVAQCDRRTHSDAERTCRANNSRRHTRQYKTATPASRPPPPRRRPGSSYA